MERFVFVAAIVGALAFALAHMIGGGASFSFDFSDFEGGVEDALVEARPGKIDDASFAASEIELRGLAARVVVIPEDRTDIAVSIDNPGSLPMPEASNVDGELIISGQIRGRVEECLEDAVEVRGYGLIPAPELPLVTLRTPRTLIIEFDSGAVTEIGPSRSLEATFLGCGSAQIGDVEDTFDLEMSGSAKIGAGAARVLTADIAGAGELRTGAIAESASIDLGGAGEIELASLSGALTFDSAGSGSLAVRGGSVTEAKLDLAGSGGVEIDAPVERLEVSIVGSGGVNVGAPVGAVDADIAGSGLVTLASVTGAINKEVWGSGDVRVGQ